MKKLSVILLMVAGLVFAGAAEAAKPKKKRTRNANRVGIYAVGSVGQTIYSSSPEAVEQDLVQFLADREVTNIEVSSEDSDIGYQASFGYRFTRYFAAEFSLAQYGEMSSEARGDYNPEGTVLTADAKADFSFSGPMVSVIGILPAGERFEFFGRLGYLFASARREFATHVDGDLAGGGMIRADSQDLVYGIGASYHVSQVYSLRLEYQRLDDIGSPTTGSEDAAAYLLGLTMRF
jgi:opacity protein-like surface antigen